MDATLKELHEERDSVGPCSARKIGLACGYDSPPPAAS